MEEGSYPIIIAILSVLVVILLGMLIVNYLLQRKKYKTSAISLNTSNRDLTEEDIISIVKESHEQGVILESEAEMIHNIFEFDDKEAKDIMTHRKNIICIDGELSYNDALVFAVENGKSRFPVYEGDIDHIIGVLHIKEMLAFAQRNEVFRTEIKDIKGLIKDVEFVPETLGINLLFKEMQKKKSHITMVVDEYGQISGIVCMEDILEEIVGNIEDEHDVEQESISPEDDGTYILDGIMSFEEVRELLDLPEDEYEFETLNGFIVSLLGHIPAEDEYAEVEKDNYKYKILTVNDNMIGDVRVSKIDLID